MNIRKARAADIEAVGKIYEAIHEAEARGELSIGWARGVYPVEATAAAAVERGDLFVAEADGALIAAAVINRLQVDVYADGAWEFPAADEEAMVLHTLCVLPELGGKGLGKEFVAFYEDYARKMGCPYLRMDTNEKNLRARSMYKKLGYKEIGTVPCSFNGIEGVELVLLEKKLD